VVKRRRVLALLFLLIGVANLVRAFLTTRLLPVLEEWPSSIPLSVLGWGYLLCGVVFIGVSFTVVWKGTTAFALPLAIAYQVLLWSLHVLAYRATYARNLWARDLVLTLLFLGVVAFLVWKPET